MEVAGAWVMASGRGCELAIEFLELYFVQSAWTVWHPDDPVVRMNS